MRLNIPRFRYIAMNRLGFTDKETSFLSFGEYADLYREYQNLFDIENMLQATKKTYKWMLHNDEETEKPIEF